MKLSALSPKKHEFEVKTPTGEGTGIFFTLQSPKAKTVREKQLASTPIEMAMMKQLEKLQKADDPAADREKAINNLIATSTDLITAQAEFLATAVVNWRGVTDDDGNDQPFDRAELTTFLALPENEHIAVQIAEELRVQANFFR